jgi:hypothetical protein
LSEKRKGADSSTPNKLRESSMLKSIAEVAPELLAFLGALQLPLSKPQEHHVAQAADALITTEGGKTLSAR